MLKLETIKIPKELNNSITEIAIDLPLNPYKCHQSYLSMLKNKIQNKWCINNKLESQLRNKGAAIITNLPIDSKLPNTPTKDKFSYKDKDSYISESSILFLSDMIGKLKSYPQEKDGAFIHNIYPLEQLKNSASNHGFDNELEFHNEIAFDEDRPDYLILLCLRQDKNQQAKTRLSCIKTALKRIPQQYQSELYKNEFMVKAPESFANSKSYISMPMIRQTGNDIHCAFNFNKQIVITKNKIAQTALLLLKQALSECAINIKLKPRSAIIFDNRKFVHARSPFKAQNNRWLQRVYIKEDICNQTT